MTNELFKYYNKLSKREQQEELKAIIKQIEYNRKTGFSLEVKRLTDQYNILKSLSS